MVDILGLDGLVIDDKDLDKYSYFFLNFTNNFFREIEITDAELLLLMW